MSIETIHDFCFGGLFPFVQHEALLDFKPVAGQLVPPFKKGRRRYSWLRATSLERGEATFTFVKSLGGVGTGRVGPSTEAGLTPTAMMCFTIMKSSVSC